jgi:SAM-dependent methyltransferase
MFFAKRITGIRPTDRVLEVGPGNAPHPRSDILLELDFANADDAAAQRGGGSPLVTRKPVVHYDGTRFPFADGEFDYVICSHVLEHVPDIASFVAEVFRVGRRGYFEYPTIYYDYLYNFPSHLNFVKRTPDALLYLRKADTALDQFRPLQRLFYNALEHGNAGPVNELFEFMFEGFEWNAPFVLKRARDISDMVFDDKCSVPRPGLFKRKLLSVLQVGLRRDRNV